MYRVIPSLINLAHSYKYYVRKQQSRKTLIDAFKPVSYSRINYN